MADPFLRCLALALLGPLLAAAAPGERFTDDFARVGGEWRLLAPDAAPVVNRAASIR